MEMSYDRIGDLRQIRFIRRLGNAREFEKTAFSDVKQYIELPEADLGNIELATCWLEDRHAGEAPYACVLFVVPDDRRRRGRGRRGYIARPERVFRLGIHSYFYCGSLLVYRNKRIFIGYPSSSI